MSSADKFYYTNLKDIVNPAHTAVVVWDTVIGIVDTIFNKDDFLVNLKGLVTAARKNGVPIFYTRFAPPLGENESPWRRFNLFQRYGAADPSKLPEYVKWGHPASEIHPEIAPTADDTVIPKFTPSIFVGTNFEYIVRNRHIDTLIFTGIATEIGIDATSREASTKGFYSIVAEDCVSSHDKELHDWTLKGIRTMCMVMPARDIVAQWPVK